MTTDRSKRSAYPKTGAVQLAINASPTETGSNTIWSELKLRFTAILSAESPLKCRPWVLVRNALDIEVLMIMPPPGEWFIVNNGEELELLFTNVLTPGVYSVSYGAIDQDGNIAEWVEDGYSLIVDGSFSSGPPFDGRLGLTTIPGAWRMGR